jgi:hypothetical protein
MANRGPQNFYTIVYTLLLKIFSFFWSVIILGVAVNVISDTTSPILPKNWRYFISTPFTWAIDNPVTTLLIAIIFFLSTIIIYQKSHHYRGIAPAVSEQMPDIHPIAPISTPEPASNIPNQPQSEKNMERRYLLRMIRETEVLRLIGIPAGLVAPSVPLDDVFIPLMFLPKRLPSDYPITREEFTCYREMLKNGQFSEEMERVFLGTEKTWVNILKKGDQINIVEFWQQLTSTTPVAVIQGYPGMGKSTLMARLTLHFARCGSDQLDPSMGNRLESSHATPIPVLLLLKEYAIELEKALALSTDLSLIDYIKIVTDQFHIPDLFAFFQTCLENGRCLIIFDGLDEVSELHIRKRVKQAIETFILDHRDNSTTRFNRFLITSRVAGYDVIAFSDYLHFTIAELTPEQISNFLPRWCLASIQRGTVFAGREHKETVTRDAELMAKRLSNAVKMHQGVGQLAQNPLLLTLLATMQQNSIELPRQRVELYIVVTRTLLESRNIAKDLQPIPETQVIQRLGPIAFQMQESGNSFARQKDVKASLRETIKQEGGSPAEIEREVENFLARIRERGGLFVIRTGDYFGFFHRSFQEYFAARYILNLIKRDPETWIVGLIERVCTSGDLWREPFLLAVAYQSGEDEIVARKLIQILLDKTQEADFARQVHDLLLATECLIETKPLTIGSVLEKQIASQLLQRYEQAQKAGKFEVSESIEGCMQRWLLNLPHEAYRPAPLIVLVETISNTHHILLQRATLTLLIMIGQQLAECPSCVFDMLVPPLLTLADLPAIGKFYPTTTLSVTSDFAIADLALTALSFMGKPGPSGQLLLNMRQYFKDSPADLYQLARYSLECGTLITPIVAPLAQNNYEKYEVAIAQWITLRTCYQQNNVTEQDISTCLAIQNTLLNCAEEASYPTATHIVSILQEVALHPDQSWQSTWQQYLLDQLTSGCYVYYQEMALLWAILFPEQQALNLLTSHILAHYSGNLISLQRSAQRFIALLCNDLKDLKDLDDLNDLRDLKDPKNLKDLRDIKDLKDLRYMSFFRYLKDIKDLGDLREARELKDTGVSKALNYLRDVRNLLHLKDLKDLRNSLLTPEVIEQAKGKLLTADTAQYVDLLTLLLGRILQFQEADNMEKSAEKEIRQIADIALDTLTTKRDIALEGIEATLDIIRYLPAHSADEVFFILQLAEDTTDTRIHTACSESLRHANPDLPEILKALETGKQSSIKVIRYSVEKVIHHKK